MPVSAAQRICDLVHRIRPADLERPDSAIRAEIARLAVMPEEGAEIAGAIIELLQHPRQGALFAEAGVRSALGFSLELLHRVGRRLMPPPTDESSLNDLMRRAFRGDGDEQWVAAVPDVVWRDLCGSIGLRGDAGSTAFDALAMRLGEAALMLSHRLAGGSLDRELLRLMPELESLESPFLEQNRLLNGLLASSPGRLDAVDQRVAATLHGSFARCQEAICSARRRAHEWGVTVRLSYLLSRLEQLVDRLRVVLGVLVPRGESARDQAVLTLLCTLVGAVRSGRGVLVFVADDLRLLARNMTDHASRRGEHYIASDGGDLMGMAAAAAGGGALIAVLALFKVRIALMHLPPVTEGILFGLNYGLGFVLIYLLGCSVATKQPSMTAATIAARLDAGGSPSAGGLPRLLRDVARSQLVAVAGNVAVALPVAAALALLWSPLFGEPVMPSAKAERLLHEIDPVGSGALLFAAVAGIGLFLSGLVSGYFDNQCRYGRFIERIPGSRYLSWVSPEAAGRIARLIDRHYGAVMGNLFFGFFLALVGESANLTGLPLDVRHVAFSTANAGMGIVVTDPGILAHAWLGTVSGIVAIGAINLTVSFWLALNVAMLSRNFDVQSGRRRRESPSMPGS